MFLEWCEKEGVVMPKLEYPATFENGLVGVRCKEDIEFREAFLYIPYKMILNVTKIRKDPILQGIIKKFPACFSKEKNSDFEALHLALGMYYEISKGKKSYWYPYIR